MAHGKPEAHHRFRHLRRCAMIGQYAMSSHGCSTSSPCWWSCTAWPPLSVHKYNYVTSVATILIIWSIYVAVGRDGEHARPSRRGVFSRCFMHLIRNNITLTWQIFKNNLELKFGPVKKCRSRGVVLPPSCGWRYNNDYTGAYYYIRYIIITFSYIFTNYYLPN